MTTEEAAMSGCRHPHPPDMVRCLTCGQVGPDDEPRLEVVAVLNRQYESGQCPACARQPMFEGHVIWVCRCGWERRPTCPACGRESVMQGREGHLVCPHNDCPAPWAADDLAAERSSGPASLQLDPGPGATP